ncbi:MAG: aminotransferase class V-fold PLP-dependent enzyme [Eubacterium sp.]|nr:aminotransferase class V-fold PLP-dependent enzyme [Eubacterium sp.]
MVSFASDYIAGAHPAILKRLEETNMEALPGYGTDKYCERAKEKIREAVGIPDADVEFITGGTETNQVVISTMLHDFEGVVAAETGHINTHEAGAVEFTGHKVLPLPQKEGKISAADLKALMETFYGDENHEHEVFPGMVYISYPTEYGTLYSRKEFEEISAVCREYGIPLFLDGARLAYGLASKACDVTLRDIAGFCDVFYIGGTKCGALCGEAVVFTKHNRPAHFMNSVKKRGALLAKGRLLGVQFDTLFSPVDPRYNLPVLLYEEIGRYGIGMAERLEKIFRDRGYEFFLETPTNQKFIVLRDEEAARLSEKIAYGFWEKPDDDHTVVRLAASWSTTEEDLEELEAALG